MENKPTYEELLLGKRNAKIMSGEMAYKPRKAIRHEEADLHLSYVHWLHKEYPDLKFVRHEKEKKRSQYMQNLMLKYNKLDGLPDFELMHTVNFEGELIFNGFYIEFKKPRENWVGRDGLIKTRYMHQYHCHLHLWHMGRCAYFCNDLEIAKQLTKAYLSGLPVAQQIYDVLPF